MEGVHFPFNDSFRGAHFPSECSGVRIFRQSTTAELDLQSQLSRPSTTALEARIFPLGVLVCAFSASTRGSDWARSSVDRGLIEGVHFPFFEEVEARIFPPLH